MADNPNDELSLEELEQAAGGATLPEAESTINNNDCTVNNCPNTGC